MSDELVEAKKQVEGIVARYRDKIAAKKKAEEDIEKAGREEEARLERIDDAVPMIALRLAKLFDSCGLNILGVYVFADDDDNDSLIVRCHVHVNGGSDGDWLDDIEGDPGSEFARFGVDWNAPCTDVWLEYDGERIADAVAVGIAVDRLEEWMRKAGEA